mgnify:CR=1 FL=1
MSKKYQEYKGLNLPNVAKTVMEKWDTQQVLEQSVTSREGKKPYVFFEGPPSANGLPGIHHVMARSIKDIFCRYKTQKGFQVKRKAGWDTHGLPVELGTEKELGSILYFKEIVEGTTVKYKWRIIEVTENKLVKMKALYFYPVYLTIALESITENKTIVHHSLDIGYRNNFLSLIPDWVVGRTLFSIKKRKSQQLHAIEEYTNLENLLN